MPNYILVTGGTGFLGTAIIPRFMERGKDIIALVRSRKKANALLPSGVVVVEGDVTKPDLGLGDVPKDITACYHLAAIHTLREKDKDGSIWKTNVDGTKNVIDFCAKHSIPHLYFCSTAYTEGRNPYEQSKKVCEVMVNHSDIPKVTIFKPSVVMGTEAHPYPGHFSQFVSAVIKIHQRAEIIRQKVEGTLRLPVIQPVFRIKGNPEGKLNLVTVDIVAKAMGTISSFEDEGVFWLTNPNPPTLKELVDWVGEFIMLDFRILSDFQPNPMEMAFQKMATAFEPYLEGDDFPSDLPTCHITKEFIHDTIKRAIPS